MRVLMQIRANAFTCPGGDTIQMQKTKDALIAMGYDVDLSLDLRPDLSQYDVVHLFNITRVQETYIQIQNAVKQKKHIVLSTIYWPNTEFEKLSGGTGLRGLLGKIFTIDQTESIKALAKYLLMGNHDEGTKYLITHSYQNMQRYILEHAEIFLPNAYQEMVQIKKHLNFSTDDTQIVVVPNAIDIAAVHKADSRGDEAAEKYKKYKDWLVCVGRIDARKNQLKLLEALRGSDYNLLLIGKCSPGQKGYFKKVMKEIEGNPHIEYIEQLPNEELYQIYKVCKVSILPSWFETPGLVSLEAASMRCNVVISDKGTTQDYFGKYAYYCDVMNAESIREQIDLAYNTPFDEALREKILKEYTWDMAAAATARGYEIACGGTK